MEIQNKQNHMENKQPLQICSSLPVYQNSVDKAVNVVSKSLILVSLQLKAEPERYISHYEVSHGRVLIYFNEVRLELISIHNKFTCLILKDFFSHSSSSIQRNAFVSMLNRQYQSAFCSLLKLYSTIIMNQVNFYLIFPYCL